MFVRFPLAGRLLIALLALVTPAAAQQQVRIATYNIKFLNTSISQDRLTRLKEAIELLDADIIGLQEIKDRASLEQVFDPTVWDIVIDDDSNEAQDVALVVRRPLRAGGFAGDLDADDGHFLFSGSANDAGFPDRRDLLCIPVEIPGESEPLHVLVHHAKSRMGGRDVTDSRRELASRLVLSALELGFDGKRFAIVGDFNDNPDDGSLNILEAGQPGALAGPEEIEGPFLLNLCEPLVLLDHVSWGLRASDIVDGRINTVRPGSRQKNNDERGTAGRVSPILFDQILIPVGMTTLYIPGSAKVFDDPAAILGGANAASDHLPVFADLFFPGPIEPPPPPPSGVIISALFPDPIDEDRGREEVTLRNTTSVPVDLAGWRLSDRASNIFELGGIIDAGGTVTFVLPVNELPLNNGGDEVTLHRPDGSIAHSVTYTGSQAKPGVRIHFP